MEFIVPKFIEREMRVIGPLTLKQFGFLAGVGAICFIVYYLYRPLFWPALIFIGGGGAALAFLKIREESLPKIIVNFLKFLLSPKVYTWKMKKFPIYKPPIRPKKKGESPLEIGGGIELKKLKTKIETGKR